MVTIYSKSNLLKVVKCLFKKLSKSEKQNNLLLTEIDHLKQQVNLSHSTNQVQLGTSTPVEKLEEENFDLKGQVERLKKTLETFEMRSKCLNMVLGSQRDMYKIGTWL